MQRSRAVGGLFFAMAMSLAASSYGQSIASADPDEARILDVITASHILTNEGILDSFGHIQCAFGQKSGSFFHAARHAAGARVARRHCRSRA
jgi:hypothetical protein